MLCLLDAHTIICHLTFLFLDHSNIDLKKYLSIFMEISFFLFRISTLNHFQGGQKLQKMPFRGKQRIPIVLNGFHILNISWSSPQCKILKTFGSFGPVLAELEDQNGTRFTKSSTKFLRSALWSSFAISAICNWFIFTSALNFYTWYIFIQKSRSITPYFRYK